MEPGKVPSFKIKLLTKKLRLDKLNVILFADDNGEYLVDQKNIAIAILRHPGPWRFDIVEVFKSKMFSESELLALGHALPEKIATPDLEPDENIVKSDDYMLPDFAKMSLYELKKNADKYDIKVKSNWQKEQYVGALVVAAKKLRDKE